MIIFTYHSSYLLHFRRFDSLWPSDATWRQRSRSTLAQLMACCLTAPIHYLNQCWLNISEALRHSTENDFTRNYQDMYLLYHFENYGFQISTTSSRGQWVKELLENTISYIYHKICTMYTNESLHCKLHLEWAIIMQIGTLILFVFTEGLCTHNATYFVYQRVTLAKSTVAESAYYI